MGRAKPLQSPRGPQSVGYCLAAARRPWRRLAGGVILGPAPQQRLCARASDEGAQRRSVGAGYPWRLDAAGSCSCNGSASWRGPSRLAALAQLSGAPGLPRGAQGSGDSPGVGWSGVGEGAWEPRRE